MRKTKHIIYTRILLSYKKGRDSTTKKEREKRKKSSDVPTVLQMTRLSVCPPVAPFPLAGFWMLLWVRGVVGVSTGAAL